MLECFIPSGCQKTGTSSGINFYFCYAARPRGLEIRQLHHRPNLHVPQCQRRCRRDPVCGQPIEAAESLEKTGPDQSPQANNRPHLKTLRRRRQNLPLLRSYLCRWSSIFFFRDERDGCSWLAFRPLGNVSGHWP